MLGTRENVDGKVKSLLRYKSFVLWNFSCHCSTTHAFGLFKCAFYFDTSQHGKYKWQTYQEVYDMVIKDGNSIRSCGYGVVSLLSLDYRKM
jgi:hypothetical protein